MAEILQKVSRSEKSICGKCSHRFVCRALDNQPCFECNRFAEEVVRCKDCAWSMRDDDVYYCINPDGLDNYAKPDDFCSYGERREA